jgi:hypothetical protein
MAPFQSPVHTIRSVAPAEAAVNSNGSFDEARQPRRGWSQSLARTTQRAKSSVPTLLRHGIVPTRCPVKRSRFNQAVRTWPRPGTPAIEQARPN